MRTKLGILGLCAVALGMMAMSVSAAQGASLDWLVLNAAGTIATLVVEEEVAGKKVVNLLASVVAEKDSADLTLLTKIIKLMISVTCTTPEFINVNLEKEGTLSLGKVKFTGCLVYNGAGLGTLLPCTVSTGTTVAGTIEAENATSKLVLHEITGGGKEVLIQVVPDVGTTFATLLFKGSECPLPEVNEVKGSLFLKDCLKLATTHEIKHLVEQGPLTSLTVGADTAEHLETSLIGSVFAKLGGAHAGLKWAAMDTP